MKLETMSINPTELHAPSEELINNVIIMVKTTQCNEWAPTGQSLKNAPNTVNKEVYHPHRLVVLSIKRKLTV